MASSRRQLFIMGGTIFAYSKVNACSFGDIVIKHPLEEALGVSGFKNVTDFLVNTHPELPNNIIEHSNSLNIEFKPLAENTLQRLLTVSLNEPLSPLTQSSTLILVLQHTIKVKTASESLISSIHFEEIASFDFQKGTLPYIATRIQSQHSGSILHAAIHLKKKIDQRLIINQSSILHGDPCLSHQYY